MNNQKRVIYKGRKYQQVLQDEKIAAGAIHRLGQRGPLYPLANPQESVGKTPAHFDSRRMFYNLIKK